MHPTTTLLEKIFLFIKLSAPLTITQFALVAGSFVAIFLSGQYSTVDMAGVSIGYNIWIAIYMGILGILLGITPIISQLLGARKNDGIAIVFHHGLYLAMSFVILIFLAAFFFLQPLLNYLNLEPAAYEVCINYLSAIAFGVPALFLMCPMRYTIESHGYTHYSMIIMISGLCISSITSYLFVFGKYGFPELGGMGAGIGTTIACWTNFLMYTSILWFKSEFKSYGLLRQWPTLDITYIIEQLRLGIPIGLSIFCEGSIFSIAGLLMAQFGTSIVAAHQAAISFTNLFYCIPLSISMASTIAVAYEVGAKKSDSAMNYAYIARGLALFLAILLCSFSFTHIYEISSIYSNDEAQIHLIMTFMSYSVFFSAIDAFGTPIQGILRGYKDVRSISYISVGSYWGVCFPLAYVLIHYFNYGPYSVWIGLLSSVATASFLFTLRLAYIQHLRKY